MSAKKKALKLTRGERATMVIGRWATMESELDRLRKQLATTESDRMYVEKRLAEANELLQSGQETMREHAGVVVELTEALRIARAELAMKELQLDNFEGTIRALEEQSGFWQDEFQRLQDRLVLQLAEEARSREPTAVED